MSKQLPDAHCPICQYVVSAAFNHEDAEAVPVVGDLSICIECGEVAAYTENLQLRKLTQEELDAIPADTLMQISLYKRALARMWRDRVNDQSP